MSREHVCVDWCVICLWSVGGGVLVDMRDIVGVPELFCEGCPVNVSLQL